MMNRIFTFAGKTRHRGLRYVRALSTYHAHSARYRLVAFCRELLGPSTQGVEAPRPSFHFDPAEIANIVASIPESAKLNTLFEAHQSLQGRFSFRGLPEVHFPKAIDWDFVPDGNFSWSWDLNRHRFFLTLGTAYFYTQDVAYQDRLITFWRDWMQHNPPGKGQNWLSPFEVAARLRNWIWAYFFLAASEGIDSMFLRQAWNGICQHASYLADHLEYHWPNNHLLLESLSLCEFAVVFRGSGGERYLSLASRVLADQVEQQVLPDGVHSELCPMYHEIVASEMNAFVRLCRRIQHRLPATMEERVHAMSRFSLAMRREDGSFPLLGDSSSPDTCLRFDLNPSPRNDLTYWLASSKNSLPTTCIESQLSLNLFPEAGYGILRGKARQTHLTFDFGPFSRCATANHGHADGLNFELYAAGRPWIVDSGYFFPWKGDSTWSHYFRSTAAHNTLLIDGKEQAELSEYWDIGRQAKSRLVGYRTNSEEVSICAEVEPYWSVGKAVHRREIILSQCGDTSLIDSVIGTAACELQWLFHFAPDLEVEIPGSNRVVVRGENAMLICEIICSGPAPHLRLIHGKNTPRQGWVAQSSATVAPAWVLAVETKTVLPCEMKFHFRIENSCAATQGLDFCFSGKA